MGYIASSMYLLEHAVWSWGNAEAEEIETDVEVLRRWIVESGFAGVIKEAERAKNGGVERLKADTRIAKL